MTTQTQKPGFVYVTKDGVNYNFPESAWDRMDDTLRAGYLPQQPAPMPDVVSRAMVGIAQQDTQQDTPPDAPAKRPYKKKERNV